jgi:hypothetical protein
MAKGSKYTPEMIAAIQAQSPLDLDKAKALADTGIFQEAGVSARGIIAKVRTLGLEYHKVERKAKDGSVIVRKDEIVAAIEAATGVTGLDTLAKADKQALKVLLDAIS